MLLLIVFYLYTASFSFHICQSICLFVSVSFTYLPVCLCFCYISVCLLVFKLSAASFSFTYMSFCLYVSLSFTNLSFCLYVSFSFANQSDNLSVCLSVFYPSANTFLWCGKKQFLKRFTRQCQKIWDNRQTKTKMQTERQTQIWQTDRLKT